MHTRLAGSGLRYPDGSRALTEVTLSFAPGEQVAVIGPSGAGKTSLLHVLAASLQPTEGNAEILGSDPWRLGHRERHALRGKVFLAPQAPPLPPRQRVVNAVLAGRLAHWGLWRSLASLWTPSEAALAYDALARFDVEDKLWMRCDRLSGGERQRVALARVMVSDAPLVLLDEPVSALDPVLGAQTLEVLQDACARRGATLVASLHDVELARARFPRLVGLRQGRIVFDRPAWQVDGATLADLYGAEASHAAFNDAQFEPALPGMARCV